MTQDTTLEKALEPVAVRSDEGEARWWFGGLAVIKATAADTGGQMTIVEVTEPPGVEAPLHVHHREDEGFWILEGNATFEVGETTIEAQRGRLRLRPARHPAPLHGRRRRLPDAVHPDSRLDLRRHRGPDQGNQRARPEPNPSAGPRGRADAGGDRGAQGSRQEIRLWGAAHLRRPEFGSMSPICV